MSFGWSPFFPRSSPSSALWFACGARRWRELFGHWARLMPGAVIRALLFAAELALIGLVAEMVMALPMAVYFHRATLFALPANMLTVPVVSLLAPLAVLTFCAALLGPWVAIVPAAGTALLLHGIVWIIGRVSQIQTTEVRVPAPAWWIGVGGIRRAGPSVVGRYEDPGHGRGSPRPRFRWPLPRCCGQRRRSSRRVRWRSLRSMLAREIRCWSSARRAARCWWTPEARLAA